jgi:hypothetical protein
MKTITRILLALGAAFLISPVTLAQNGYQVSFANYTVHYNTFPSEFLEPQVSKAVGIKRSASRGVITIAVKQKTSTNTNRSVEAAISGTASNLIGQIRRLKMTKVKDGEAVYYVGAFPVAKNETLTFDVSVQPEGYAQRQEFKFRRKF